MTNLDLYCLELRTSRWDEMLAWYRDLLGLKSLIRIDEDRYALLSAGGTRVAIVGSEGLAAATGRHVLVFEAAELETLQAAIGQRQSRLPDIREHAEGFRQLSLEDPDGNRVRIICWPAKAKRPKD
jgi:catechol 2,3-dioxygenase-like lactoylglutathione lyase family enzyme